MLDFRSDTVTQPSNAMRQAMLSAPVGDDVYEDDPSVNKLQEMAAEMSGFDAALFTPSGTQANLIALMSHCERGDEYICGQQAHNYIYEGGGAAVLGSVQAQPIENLADGSLDLVKMRAAIKSDDIHFVKTKLISLENTINGKVLSHDFMAQAQALAFEYNLRMHLDGARAFNAAVKLGEPISSITQYFDSTSICLSKGLGAPVGSLLLGDTKFINKAKRWRKTCGGGMRQAGMLAAAGIFALEHNVERLADDHLNARYLADALENISELDVNPALVQTNMVFVKSKQVDFLALAEYLKSQGILISPGKVLRLVTHLNVDKTSIDTLVAGIKDFIKEK
ncbi:low-specificity L-threonine aldolase [Motilimonas sp. 1_MG-2023]|uniref:low-specificity L-threonine aldolase n=1 Tax=Motilimonas sp. 1_MG-2023 TaxID=3062672 RepID=UPI0026E340A3|nr:low-specificity L-threonine aldolase [Motilimonas sp. 1_MG-2023]MDO6526450.1 low-specificity L-threonine aldolase [Motilimonas sp. 1_MG-2023]